MDLVLVPREVKVNLDLQGLTCLEAAEEEGLALKELKALYFRVVEANLDLEGLIGEEDCASLALVPILETAVSWGPLR